MDQQQPYPGLAPQPAVPAPAQPMTAQPAAAGVPEQGYAPAPQVAPQYLVAQQQAPVGATPGLVQQPVPSAQPAPGVHPAFATQPGVPAQQAMPAVIAPARQAAAQPVAQSAAPAVSEAALAARATQLGSYERASTEQTTDHGLDLSAALIQMVERGASDLHLTVGSPPLIRLHGHLTPIPDMPVLEPNAIQQVLYSICTQKQRERFEAELELDFSYALPGSSRFRVNMYRQRESVGAAFRRIPYEILSLEKLGVQESVANFAALPRGMVLVTGPTGSGKSTTLAALVDLVNRTRQDHIMTVEDPIEFLHHHKSCMVNQREVGEDTKSFANALKHVLRQDPDIILVGELRDLETISVALTAAETGHLVFATLHTQDAGSTIDRMVDVFPPHQQQQVRTQLAGCIQGVVCQTLCRTRDGKGRVVAVEVMIATPAIRNLIREGKTHQIYSALQAGAKHGMNTMDQHLAELVQKGKITMEHALDKCHHIEDFNRLAGRV